MGMFDQIRFEDYSALPKPEGFDLDMASLDFQTKSLDNAMYTYRVGGDKQLYREDGPFRGGDGEERRELVDFHGVIRFGAYEQTDLVDHHLEYEAKFTDGLLQGVKLLEYKTYSHESKKTQREEYIKECEKRKNRLGVKLARAANSIFGFPFLLAGFTSNVPGVFRSESSLLTFHLPKIMVGRREDLRCASYGVSLDKITTEARFSRTLASKEFSFKILGIGFGFVRFKKDLVFD